MKQWTHSITSALVNHMIQAGNKLQCRDSNHGESINQSNGSDSKKNKNNPGIQITMSTLPNQIIQSVKKIAIEEFKSRFDQKLQLTNQIKNRSIDKLSSHVVDRPNQSLVARPTKICKKKRAYLEKKRTVVVVFLERKHNVVYKNTRKHNLRFWPQKKGER